MKKYIPFLFSLFLIGCGNLTHQIPEKNFSVFIDFGEEGLIPEKNYLFDNLDSLANVSKLKNGVLEICVRYTDRCKIKNLPLNVEYSSLSSDSIYSKSIEINLFDNEDNVKGKGNFGIYETVFPVISDINFKDALYISISTTENLTSGILSLGVKGISKNQ